MPPRPRRHRSWSVWATGDAVAILGFLGVIEAPGSSLALVGVFAVVVGVVLIVVGAAGDYR